MFSELLWPVGMLLAFAVPNGLVALAAVAAARRIGFPGLGVAAAVSLFAVGQWGSHEVLTTWALAGGLSTPGTLRAPTVLLPIVLPTVLGAVAATGVLGLHAIAARRRPPVRSNGFWIAGAVVGVLLLGPAVAGCVASALAWVLLGRDVLATGTLRGYMTAHGLGLVHVATILLAVLGELACLGLGALGWWWEHRFERRVGS